MVGSEDGVPRTVLAASLQSVLAVSLRVSFADTAFIADIYNFCVVQSSDFCSDVILGFDHFCEDAIVDLLNHWINFPDRFDALVRLQGICILLNNRHLLLLLCNGGLLVFL